MIFPWYMMYHNVLLNIDKLDVGIVISFPVQEIDVQDLDFSDEILKN